MTGLSDQDIIIAAKLRSGKKLTVAEIARLRQTRERSQRAEWVPCNAPHAGDVIRWTEPVRLRDTTAAAILGRRRVIAQVLGREADRLSLCVMSQEWLGTASAAPELQAGEKLRRKPSALSAGECHRLAR
jgi:hypothetical protein